MSQLPQVIIWNHSPNEHIYEMYTPTITQQFGGGVTIENGIPSIELLFNNQCVRKNCIHLQTYDANMFPLPNFSE